MDPDKFAFEHQINDERYVNGTLDSKRRFKASNAT